MMKLILFSVVALAVVGLSTLAYSRIGVFSLAGGSDSTLRLMRAPWWVVVASAAALLAWAAWSIWDVPAGGARVLVLVALLLIWVLSGRVVGLFPDGRLVWGWFFIPTGTLDFRDPAEDDEAHAAHTQISSSGWMVEVRSHEQRARLFAGPILRGPLLDLLKDRGFSIESEAAAGDR